MKGDPGERAATLDLDFSHCAAVDDTFKTNDFKYRVSLKKTLFNEIGTQGA